MTMHPGKMSRAVIQASQGCNPLLLRLCRARAEARDKAAAYLAAGNVAMAQECYQRCVDITPAMAKQVIEVSATQRRSRRGAMAAVGSIRHLVL